VYTFDGRARMFHLEEESEEAYRGKRRREREREEEERFEFGFIGACVGYMYVCIIWRYSVPCTLHPVLSTYESVPLLLFLFAGNEYATLFALTPQGSEVERSRSR
jgi:hypothetical protein